MISRQNMAGGGTSLPAGFGGLMRYDEEYKSSISLSPSQVIGFAVLILLFVVSLNLFFPS